MAKAATVAVLAVLASACAALTVKIEPRKELCFYYDFTANAQVQASLEVTRGGLLDIRYKVSAPSQQTHLTHSTHTEHTHAHTANMTDPRPVGRGACRVHAL